MYPWPRELPCSRRAGSARFDRYPPQRVSFALFFAGRPALLLASPLATGGLFLREPTMRHYEIVLLVHPDQSEQVPAMVERYRGMISAGGGTVHRFEDWGRRQLTFPISKVHKAHYILLNIEVDQKTLDELNGSYRFSDAALRHLVVKMEEAVTEPSPRARAPDENARRHDDFGDDGDDDDMPMGIR